ncbi:MAG: hypothetical protein ACRBI6_06130 [Acidimicrobiales bacterium]
MTASPSPASGPTDLPALPRLEVEFTVEPFHDAAPGPHVEGAIEAVTTALDGVADATIDIGPFGTAATGPGEATVDALAAALRAAFANGATRVSVQVTAASDGEYPPST